MDRKFIFLYLMCIVIVHGDVIQKLAKNVNLREIFELVGSGIPYFNQIYAVGSKLFNAFFKDEPQEVEEKNPLLPLSMQLVQIQDQIKNLTKEVIEQYVNTKIEKLQSVIYEIDERFDEASRIYNGNYSDDSNKIFAEQAINKNTGVYYKLIKLHELTVLNGDSSLLKVLNAKFEIMYGCKLKQSKQRYFYELMVSILNYIYEAVAIVQYAYKILEDLGEGPTRQSSIDLQNYANSIAAKTISEFYEVICGASRVVQSCDLQKNHEWGFSYTDLSIFQRIFYVHDDFGEITDETCPSFNGFTPDCEIHRYCYMNQIACYNVFNCQSYQRPSVCRNADRNSRNRYKYVEDYQKYTPPPEKCPMVDFTNFFDVVQGSSHTGNDVIFQDVCLCICQEIGNPNSDLYFSLDDVTSNVELNYVITAVEFTKRDKTFLIKIGEGKLLPFGNINEAKWVPLSDSQKRKKYNETRKHQISWFNNRGILLNNIEFFAKYQVITGVRFGTVTINEEVFLKLEVQSTMFNYTSGQLLLNTTKWSTHVSRKNLNIFDVGKLDSPLNIDAIHEVDSRKNLGVRFTPTHIRSKDYGSTTIPYLDIQAIYSQVPAPLSGIRLQYMKAEKSGGYIALAVKTYDTLHHIYKDY